MGIELHESYCVPCGELFPVDRFVRGNHIDCQKVEAARRPRGKAQPSQSFVKASPPVSDPSDRALEWTLADHAAFRRTKEDLTQPPGTTPREKPEDNQVIHPWKKYPEALTTFALQNAIFYVSCSKTGLPIWLAKSAEFNRKVSPGLRATNNKLGKTFSGPLGIRIQMPVPPDLSLLDCVTTDREGRHSNPHFYDGEDGKRWVEFFNSAFGEAMIFQFGADYYGVGSSKRSLLERRCS